MHSGGTFLSSQAVHSTWPSHVPGMQQLLAVQLHFLPELYKLVIACHPVSCGSFKPPLVSKGSLSVSQDALHRRDLA